MTQILPLFQKLNTPLCLFGSLCETEISRTKLYDDTLVHPWCHFFILACKMYEELLNLQNQSCEIKCWSNLRYYFLHFSVYSYCSMRNCLLKCENVAFYGTGNYLVRNFLLTELYSYESLFTHINLQWTYMYGYASTHIWIYKWSSLMQNLPIWQEHELCLNWIMFKHSLFLALQWSSHTVIELTEC